MIYKVIDYNIYSINKCQYRYQKIRYAIHTYLHNIHHRELSCVAGTTMYLMHII